MGPTSSRNLGQDYGPPFLTWLISLESSSLDPHPDQQVYTTANLQPQLRGLAQAILIPCLFGRKASVDVVTTLQVCSPPRLLSSRLDRAAMTACTCVETRAPHPIRPMRSHPPRPQDTNLLRAFLDNPSRFLVLPLLPLRDNQNVGPSGCLAGVACWKVCSAGITHNVKSAM